VLSRVLTEPFRAFAVVATDRVSLKCGTGGLPGMPAGVLLLSSIKTAINLMGLPAPCAQTLPGGLVFAAMLLDTVKLQIRQRFT
jgi:ribose transport system permease protein